MQISRNSSVVNPLPQNSQSQSSTPKRENPRHQKELKLNSISDVLGSDCFRNLLTFLNKEDAISLKRSSTGQIRGVNQILRETHIPKYLPISLNLGDCNMLEEAKRGVSSTEWLINDLGQWDTEFINHCLEKTKYTTSYRKNKRRVLFYASSIGDISLLIDTIRTLDNKRKDVNIPSRGRTPVFAAAENGHDAVIRILANSGADVNIRSRGRTPVFAAAENGRDAAICALAEFRADVNTRNYRRETPVFIAAQNGHDAAIRALANSGADVNISSFSWTPMYDAARNGYVDTIRALAENGADINKADKFFGITPIRSAGLHDHAEVVNVLKEFGAEDPNRCTIS